MPAKPDQQKSVRKVKKEATQEFFNKKRSTSVGDSTKKSQTFTFNKAPINRAEAKQDFEDNKEKRSMKRSAFTAKLYKDDDDLEEMKVLAGDNFDSDLDERPEQKKKPRDVKASRKQDFSVSTPLITSKIGKLVSLLLF